MNELKNRIALILKRAGLTANAATLLGLLLTLGTAYCAYKGYFFWAGGLLLLAGGMDLMDGAIARLSGTAGKFGGVLDSSLDRYGDFFVYIGLVGFCFRNDLPLYMLLTLSAMAGSFEISYVRARAECLIESCKVGFWERGERLVYLSLGMLTYNVTVVILVLAVGTHMTALYRLYHAKRVLGGDRPTLTHRWTLGSLLLHPGGRQSWLYAAKCLLWAALLLWVPPVP